ncbi:MAG: CHAT domain-containing protein [Symploca sp. SIO2D2]|nr:CHAT domain-containing protein [Symploca sp. SIO2D2]
MNEQRQQAYFQLIQNLLDCPSGEELEILAANAELLDAGFLKVVAASAESLANLGEENMANRLRNFATIDVYLKFMLKVLQKTAESNGDAQVIYPLLATNTNKLDHIFAKLLRRWVTNTLVQAEPNAAKSIADVIGNFSNLISDFPLGSKVNNIEIAITGYEITLTVYTRTTFPKQWARTQNNLGLTYNDRILGKRAENLENAIASHIAALEVLTRSAFPFDWATTQNKLGVAYCNRILGERAENLENAIAAFTSALEILTRSASPELWARAHINLGNAYVDRILGKRAANLENAITAFTSALEIYTGSSFPIDWAKTQNNLGIAYRNRILGEKAENLENAIAAFTSALEILTRSASPELWAKAHINLGNAYFDRILGERAENLENAIAAHTAALEVLTRSAFPTDWANMQSNLGNAYSEKILGERAKNIENAIIAYNAALEVYTRSNFPIDWAKTQNNLGNAYRNRILGERAKNIENAITAYNAALEVYTRRAFPQQWAATQNNLGTAYANRILGEKAENFENAIAAYTAALEVYTRSDFPVDWARTQNNLGLAYSDRIKGERAENLEKAITACSAALKVRTFEAFPQEYAKTLWIQGTTYQYASQFNLAYNNFEFAIATIEFLREEIVSGEESKRKQAEEWNKIYSSMIEVCLKLDNITEAIEYVERSKNRNLIEQILERDSKNIFPINVVTQLEIYRDEIAVGQYQIQNNKAENPKTMAQHLQKLRQQRNELQNRYLPVGHGFKFDSFQPTLNEHTAIIEWYIIHDKILVFIVTKQEKIKVWQSQPQDRKALENWVSQYLYNYYNQKDKWKKRLEQEIKQLVSILHIDKILNQIPNHFDQLILIPHRLLHLFPLHALPISHNGKTASLLDRFPNGVSYAPSCQLLLQAQQRKRPNFTNLFAIQNPTNDLAYTDLEVQAITDYFNPTNILKHEAATLTAINNTNLNAIHCAHFSCHGYFNLRNAGKSALILADVPLATTPTQPDTERYLKVREGETHDLNQCLTLDAIFSLNLEQCRLVTLSACETGLIDFNNISDEYIGLPSGFLIAGSPNVVSSLWGVNDLSTALLMIKFYQKLKSGSTVALALNTAQTWLRDATKEQLEQWASQLPLDDEQELQLDTFLYKLQPNSKPFESPYHWAAFCAIGQ